MLANRIPLDKIRYFSTLITDYTSNKEKTRSLYHNFPTISNFEKQIDQKKVYFSEKSREILVNSLQKQYKNVKTSEKVTQNIELLRQNTAFTVTTGHQLSLFTGHLYFLYKIISVINTAEVLKSQYPDYQFIPVYWMATEDHDFEEINHFHFQNKTVCWSSQQTGMTGNFSTEELSEVAKIFEKNIGVGKNADFLKRLFSDSYVNHTDLASATRFLVNALFENYGVVVIDGNDPDLKRQFLPFVKNDLLQNIANQQVTNTISEIQKIDKTYPIQVNPREINLFYLTPTGRNRIIRTEKGFEVHQTNLIFSESEILEEAEKYPERFSPNVILRPLYQEVTLPNLAYIGGGGEIAYWLELKSFFEAENVPFPILMLRNSVLLITDNQYVKLQKLNLSLEDLFLKSLDLKNKKMKEYSDIPIDFSLQKSHLKEQFSDLYKIAQQTDVTFLNAVKAQEIKQLQGLEQLEKRLLKAQKRKFASELERIEKLQTELFPNGSLQERFSNFAEFYLEKGENLIPILVKNLNPFESDFSVIKL